jgi:hypothetical protein
VGAQGSPLTPTPHAAHGASQNLLNNFQLWMKKRNKKRRRKEKKERMEEEETENEIIYHMARRYRSLAVCYSL